MQYLSEKHLSKSIDNLQCISTIQIGSVPCTQQALLTWTPLSPKKTSWKSEGLITPAWLATLWFLFEWLHYFFFLPTVQLFCFVRARYYEDSRHFRLPQALLSAFLRTFFFRCYVACVFPFQLNDFSAAIVATTASFSNVVALNLFSKPSICS